MGILIEHTGGKWPFWISPRQVSVLVPTLNCSTLTLRQCIVLSVSEAFAEYARSVYRQIHDAGYYVDLDDSDSTLPKKVFAAQQAQVSLLFQLLAHCFLPVFFVHFRSRIYSPSSRCSSIEVLTALSTTTSSSSVGRSSPQARSTSARARTARLWLY
jgi:hypothetical protein